ncbi:hypothetical protein [Anabaena sp. FACHB-709]|uniref:hypothetical protein n=1 Tax=Anabaena sp. FACHB-709 TaxID=1086822 RepID=UPI00168BFA21|nr:hypothetical protein [Anabaena sp. FACHB-709]MBD2265518.1 hypothetical protein [Anabaena sp. FACHB-709]
MKIYAPNIHLFAFQLYKSASNDINNSSTDKDFLWYQANAIASATLHQNLQLHQRLDVNKNPDNPRVDLLKDSEVIDDNYAVDLQGNISLNQTQDLLIKGFAHPLRIYDSYSLWLNLRRPEKENNNQTDDVDITFLRQLNQNNCFTVPANPLFLGQTLLITGWLTGAKDRQIIQQIANECLKSFFPDNYLLPPFNRQGELFGSPIFEYGLFSQLNNYQHVLIWLFTDKQADSKFNQCYQELLDLFFFRAKAVKAYKDSRKIYQELDSAYRKVEDTIDKVPKLDETQYDNKINLSNLKNQLKALPQISLTYTRLLRNLEEYQNTIAINTYNYNERLQQIKSIFANEDISFLEIFSQKNCAYFQQQINGDLGYFRHGSELLGKAIDTIRGIVEIEQAERDVEQAKRDRTLETTIQIIGIGFGGGAIASGVIVSHIDKINQPLAALSPDNQPHPFFASLILSFLAVLLFSGVGWFISWLITKWRN